MYRLPGVSSRGGVASPDLCSQSSGRNHSWLMPVTSMASAAARSGSFVCMATASGLGVAGSSRISVMRIQLR